MSFWAFWEAMATDCGLGEENRLRKKLRFIWEGRGDGRRAGRLIIFGLVSSFPAGTSEWNRLAGFCPRTIVRVTAAVDDDKAGRCKDDTARNAAVVCMCICFAAKGLYSTK